MSRKQSVADLTLLLWGNLNDSENFKNSSSHKVICADEESLFLSSDDTLKRSLSRRSTGCSSSSDEDEDDSLFQIPEIKTASKKLSKQDSQ
jgi:hypothetical protein